MKKQTINDFIFEALEVNLNAVTLTSQSEDLTQKFQVKKIQDDLGTIWQQKDGIWMPIKPDLSIEVSQEESPIFDDPLVESPYAFLSNHRRYYSSSEYKAINGYSIDEILEENTDNEAVGDFVKSWIESKGYICKKVFMYSHSGDTISSNPFSDFFDSGLFGWLYTTEKESNKYFGEDLTKAELEKDMETFINGEWDQYVTGEYYGYLITDKTGGLFIDRQNCKYSTSCTGYDYEGAKKDSEIEKERIIKDWMEIYSPFLEAKLAILV